MRAMWLALGLLVALPVTAQPRPEPRPSAEAPGRPEARDVDAPVPEVAPEAGTGALPEVDADGPAAPAVEVASGFARAESRQAPVALNLETAAPDGARPESRPRRAGLAGQPLRSAPDRPKLRPSRPPPALAFDVPEADSPHPRPGEDAISAEAVLVALRPPDRPEGLAARAAQIEVAQNAARQAGALCGLQGIQGERLGSVGGPGACGVEDAVRVTAVAGVRLSQPATLTCDTARALLAWTTRTALPAIGQAGGGLAGYVTGPGYVCRGRNNQAGARLSEHAFGRALDIMAFRLEDGSEISVLQGWNSAHGTRLRQMWQGACGPFGTVLGPNANSYHRDHFHLDTAAYRSGSYCR